MTAPSDRAATLADRLATAGLEASVSWVAATGSTNDDAKAAAARGASSLEVFVADAQTAGRGRSGHAWRSTPGQDLLMSVLVRPNLRPELTPRVTLAIGAELAGVVGELAPGRVKLKWPNDVLLDDKKLVGVLVEGQTRAEKLTALIVGVGMNVGATVFDAEIASSATSLAAAGVAREHLDLPSLAARVVRAIVSAIARFESSELATFVSGIRAIDALAGARVRVGDVEGIASGIDDLGRLLVARADGVVEPCASGHVERLADAS